jgi:hypothetical protein
MDELNKRIEDACEEAVMNFWVVIAEKFPEATTGDMMPGQEFQFTEAAHSVVKIWLENNTDLIK